MTRRDIVIAFVDHEVKDLLDELDEMPRHRTYVQVVAGCIAHAHGRLDEAEQLLVEAVDRVEALGESDLAPMSVAALVRVLIARSCRSLRLMGE